MSFIFSQALVEASSLGKCSGIDVSVQSSGNPTPQGYSSPDKTTALSRLSRFGMTFKPLTADRGAELLTSWLAGFPVKTSPLQEKEQASPAPEVACGDTWRASWARYDPDTCSWKTAQHSLLADSESSSVTWPRSGMTAGGLCWELPMSGRRIKGTDSGLWPTPVVFDSITDKMTGGATVYMDKFGKPRRKTPNGSASTGLARLVQYTWPTPTASLGTKGGLVTPAKAREGGTLIEALSARTFATPTARDWRSGKASQATHDKNSRPLSEQIGGSLNPTWVEWLQGWPLGWTDLKPLVTVKSLCVPPQPIECLFQSLEMSE